MDNEEKAIVVEKSISLKIADRILLANFLPDKGSYMTIVVRKDLEDKVRLTQTEIRDSGFFEAPPGEMHWTKDSEKTFPLTDFEVRMLKEGADRLDKNQAIPAQAVHLYEQIIKL